MTIEVLDVLALVFAIWLNIRKLDVLKRLASEHPNVAPADFERWQRMAAGAYGLGSLVCFLKLGLDLFLRLAAPALGVPWPVIRGAGFAAFLGWVGTLIYVWVRSFQARRLQGSLGIAISARIRPVETDQDEGRPPDGRPG